MITIACTLALGLQLQPPQDASRAFQRLVEQTGTFSRVRVASERGAERGLFATERVSAGELLLVLPWSLCLVSQDEPGDALIRTPWDAPPRPACDTRLAAQLLACVAGEGAEPVAEATQQFWEQWAQLLPELGSLAHPIALPPSLLAELHDEPLAAAAALQQQRVDAVMAGSLPAGLPPQTEEEAVALRRWAVAMCQSRPFRLPPPPSAATDADAAAGADGAGRAAMLTAFIPMIDMANHAPEANCQVAGRGGADGGGEYEAVGLIATRDVAEGEEVVLSYFEAQPNAFTFSRFGFVLPGSRHDRITPPIPPDVLDPLSGAAVRRTMSANKEVLDASDPRVEAALLSLPLSREASGGPAHEAAAARAIADALRRAAEKDFVTTLEADEAALAAMLAPAAPPTDPRLPGIVRYRIERKRLWECALAVLDAHAEFHAAEAEA